MSELQKELQQVKGIGKAKAQEIADKYPDRFTFFAGLYANDIDNIKGISDDIVERMKEIFTKEELESLKKSGLNEEDAIIDELEDSNELSEEEQDVESNNDEDVEESDEEPTYDEFIEAVIEFVQSEKGKELKYMIHLHQGRFLTIAYRSPANMAVNFRKNSTPYYHRSKTRIDLERNLDEKYHSFLQPFYR